MRKLAMALMATAAVAACTPEPPRVTDVPSNHARIQVTRDSNEGPEACRPAQVGELVSGFLTEFSRGDPAAAKRFLADMEWFSITEWSPELGKRHFVTSDRAGLRTFIERRSSQHEKMNLLEVDVMYDEGRDLGHIAYSIHRTADDLEPKRPIVGGKGAVDCNSGFLLLLSMAHDTKYQDVGDLCPGEADPPKTAVACAR